MFIQHISGGSRISHSAETYAIMKEIDPVGGGRRRRRLDPPMYIHQLYIHITIQVTFLFYSMISNYNTKLKNQRIKKCLHLFVLFQNYKNIFCLGKELIYAQGIADYRT